MKPKKISVFEYDRLKTGCEYSGVTFTPKLLESLEYFHASSKTSYFDLIHNGVQFREYVGVIQVNGVQIEILPKLDRYENDDNRWRDILIGMLHEVGLFRVSAPSFSSLTLRSNSILELYFEIFIAEVEYLIRTGLIKQYRRQSQNLNSLKGSLDFPRHLARNLVHRERFFTNSCVYDQDHLWHQILSQTIDLISQQSQNSHIQNRIGALKLNFPEVSPQKISERSFDSLVYSRKTEGYRTAMEIARLLLCNYHPDLKSGRNNVLALMFDMNLLWESFVYHSLRKQFLVNSAPYSVKAQHSKDFWSSELYKRYLQPDIVVENSKDGRKYVLDTKWKDIAGTGPSPSDLQQLFAYSQFFRSARNALVYPGREYSTQSGSYVISTEWTDSVSCSLIQLGVDTYIRQWQEAIFQAISEWMEAV